MTPHLTSEEICGWIIGERTLVAQQHVALCACCRGDVERLEEALRQFRESGWQWSAHWYGMRDTRQRRAVWSWRWVAAAGALVVLAAIVGQLVHQSVTPPQHDDAAFIQIPYVAPLAPYEQATVVRVDAAMMALKAAGFDVHAAEMGGVLTVDILIGQDGRAHAIRPIYRRAGQ